MTSSDKPTDKEAEAWREHNLAQLLHFRSFSLRQKMQAIEELCRVHGRIEEMREQGLLRSAEEIRDQ